MDRSKLVRMLNDKTFTAEDSLSLISEYCQDKKIDETKSSKFLSQIIQVPPLLYKVMQKYIIPFIKVKYNICSIIDQEGKTIYYY